MYSGLYVKIVIGRQLDFITVTTIIELGEVRRQLGDENVRKYTIGQLRHLDYYLSRRSEVLSAHREMETPEDDTSKHFKDIYEYLYKTFWNSINAEFCNVLGFKHGDSLPQLSERTMFCESRGLVWQYAGRTGSVILLPSISDPHAAKVVLLPSNSEHPAEKLGSAPFNIDECSLLSWVLNEFIQTEEYPDVCNKDARVPQERVVCGVLGGRCLYVSALGGGLGENTNYRTWIVLSVDNNKRQLGSVVDATCGIEALRPAGVHNVSTFRGSSDTINALFKKAMEPKSQDISSDELTEIGTFSYGAHLSRYYSAQYKTLLKRA